MTELYRDCKNVPFADVRRKHLLPEDCRTWRPKNETLCASGFRRLRYEWDRCAVCREFAWSPNVIHVDVHHLINGPRRWTERTNLLPLCSRFGKVGCHDLAHGYGDKQDRIAILLYYKWLFDPGGTDWKRLHEIAGFWLPRPRKADLRALAEKIRRRA